MRTPGRSVGPGDAAASGTSQGYLLAELLTGVLGVLFASGEYGAGMIRATLAAVPKRLSVRYAKAWSSAASSSARPWSTRSSLSSAPKRSWATTTAGIRSTDPAALRVVFGVGIYHPGGVARQRVGLDRVQHTAPCGAPDHLGAARDHLGSARLGRPRSPAFGTSAFGPRTRRPLRQSPRVVR